MCNWNRTVSDKVKMPSPVKRKVGSSAGNVSVPTGGKKEVEGGVRCGGDWSAGDMRPAKKEQDRVEEDEDPKSNCASTPRTAKKVAITRIHEGKRDEMIEEEWGRVEEDEDPISKCVSPRCTLHIKDCCQCTDS